MILDAIMATFVTSKVSFDGVFSRSQSTSPVTSLTRNCTVGGTVKFSSVFSNGGTPQYSKNGGAFTNITEGMTLAVVNADTLAVRAALTIAGQTATFSLTDAATTQSIEDVTLTRT